MNPALLAVVLAAVAAPAPAPADEEVKLPQGVQPVQIIAQMNKDGRIEVTELVTEYREEKRTKTTKVDGKEVPVEYVVKIALYVPRQRLLPEKGVKVHTAAGKEVEAKDLAEKLKKPTAVFLAWDGNKVDPFYLKLLKADTLVIVPSPPEPTPADAGAKPMPKDPPPPPSDPQDKKRPR
jgi:hypothetical protein